MFVGLSGRLGLISYGRLSILALVIPTNQIKSDALESTLAPPQTPAGRPPPRRGVRAMEPPDGGQELRRSRRKRLPSRLLSGAAASSSSDDEGGASQSSSSGRSRPERATRDGLTCGPCWESKVSGCFFAALMIAQSTVSYGFRSPDLWENTHTSHRRAAPRPFPATAASAWPSAACPSGRGVSNGR